MRQKIKLFWWRGQLNFGDLISQDIVRRVSGREVEWCSPEDCELFAVGSLLSIVKHSRNHSNKKLAPWIWGTGNLGPIIPTFLSSVRFAAVRGPLTQILTLHQCRATGDPALLLPLLMGETIKKHDRVGVILHHSKSSEILSEYCRDLLLIDPKTEHPLRVVRRIAECRFIFSSSLHGLIVADSFGVPNRLLDPSGNHRSPFYKFYDYALSVHRRLGRALSVSDLRNYESHLDPNSVARTHWVQRRQSDLIRSFPEELLSFNTDSKMRAIGDMGK